MSVVKSALQSTAGKSVKRGLVIGATLILCGSVLWAVLWAYSSVLTRVVPPLATSYSDSMEVVEVSLTDEKDDASITFKIPEAYLTDARARSGGDQRTLEMQAFLPDMIPYFRAKQKIDGEPKYSWGNWQKLSDLICSKFT